MVNNTHLVRFTPSSLHAYIHDTIPTNKHTHTHTHIHSVTNILLVYNNLKYT